MGMAFSTEVSINLADDEQLMRMMVKAGFGTVFIGIETPEEDEPGGMQQEAEHEP